MSSSARSAAAAQDTEAAVALLREWIAASRKSLAEDKLSPSERARIGELATNAVEWLTSREGRVRREARTESMLTRQVTP